MSEALDFLQNTKGRGYVFGTDNVRKTLNLFGNPDESMEIIHIAGTNGKGSCSAYLSEVLCEAGYRVGAFRSPAMTSYCDEIVVSGQNISESEFENIVLKIKSFTDYNKILITEFEVLTVAALIYFHDRNVEYAIIETGMGGRIDATNAVNRKLLSVITNIGMDHTQYLGDSLEKIASEKAGIIHNNGTVVLYPQEKEVISVIEEACREKNAELYMSNFDSIAIKSCDLSGNVFSYKSYSDVKTSLIGLYQIRNAAFAIDVVDVLRIKGVKISDEAIFNGMKNAKIEGRMELISRKPRVIVDGGHNPQGVEALISALRVMFPSEKSCFIMATFKDKDYKTSIATAGAIAKCFYTVTAPSNRGLSAEELCASCKEYAPAKAFDSLESAVDMALKDNEDDLIVIFGTLSIVSEARRLFNK